MGCQHGYGRPALFRSNGFTFVEILAVLFIVGLMISLVAIRINDNPERVLLDEAKRFSALVSLIRDQSIVSGRAYGVDIDSAQNSYRFLVYRRGWRVIDESDKSGDPLRERYLPDPVGLKVRQSGLTGFAGNRSDDSILEDGETSVAPEPEIIVTPVGEVSYFGIIFVSGGSKVLVKPGLDQEFTVVKLEEK
jgi:prepilin-type N-terminal cleavage/methylation domain-containing protein